MNEYIVLGIVAVILVISMAQFLQIASIKAEMTGKVVSAGSSADQSADDAYQQMMAEMHPEQVQAQQSGGAPAMVGGC